MVAAVKRGDTDAMVDPTPTSPPPGGPAPSDPPPTGPASAGVPPTPPPPVNRPELRLASGDKWLAGVAGGLARTLGIPSWAVRLAFVILTILGGVMVFAYLALWFFLPDESGRVIAREVAAGNDSWLPVAGVVILALAFGVTVGIFGSRDAGILVPAILVGGGIALLASRDRPQPAPTSTTAPPTTTSYPPIPPPRIAPYEVVATPPPTPRPPKPRSFLTPLTLSLLAIAGGVAFLLDRSGEIDVRVSSALAVGLIVIGAVLILATWVGRARGLIAFGLVLLPIAALAAVTLPFHQGLGQQRYAPVAATEPLVYEYGIGELTIDLRELEHRGTADVRAELGIGSLVVIVPDDVTVDVHGEAGAGEIRVTEALDPSGPFGRADDATVRTESGLGAELDQTLEADVETARRIELEAEVGLGEVVIRRDLTSP